MTTKHKALTLNQITQQLNVNQFTRLCSLIDEKIKKGVRFDILSVRPFRNNKDESMITVAVLASTSNDVKYFDIHEKL